MNLKIDTSINDKWNSESEPAKGFLVMITHADGNKTVKLEGQRAGLLGKIDRYVYAFRLWIAGDTKTTTSIEEIYKAIVQENKKGGLCLYTAYSLENEALQRMPRQILAGKVARHILSWWNSLKLNSIEIARDLKLQAEGNLGMPYLFSQDSGMDVSKFIKLFLSRDINIDKSQLKIGDNYFDFRIFQKIKVIDFIIDALSEKSLNLDLVGQSNFLRKLKDLRKWSVDNKEDIPSESSLEKNVNSPRMYSYESPEHLAKKLTTLINEIETSLGQDLTYYVLSDEELGIPHKPVPDVRDNTSVTIIPKKRVRKK